jgi:hypothetical protein
LKTAKEIAPETGRPGSEVKDRLLRELTGGLRTTDNDVVIRSGESNAN